MKSVKKAKRQAIIKETLGWITDDRKLERQGKIDKRLAGQRIERGPKNTKPAIRAASWVLAFMVVSGFSSSAGAETLVAAQKMFMTVQEQYGFGSPETVVALVRLADANEERGNHQRAVTLYRRSGAIAEKIAGPDDPFLLSIFNGLGAVYEAMKKYPAADSVYGEVRNRGYGEWADQMEFRADVMRQAEVSSSRLTHPADQVRPLSEEQLSK